MKYCSSVFLISILFLCCLQISDADSSFRHFEVYKVPEVGLIVYKPGTPEWEINVDERAGDDVVLLASPQKYFPPTSIEIRLNQQHDIARDDLEEFALVVADALRKKTNSPTLDNSRLQQIQYGKIAAFKNEFDITHQNRDLTIRHIIGRMPSGHIVTMMATTPINQIDAVEFMLSKIYSNLTEIN